MIPVRVLIVALLAMALGTSSEHLSRSTLLKRQSVPAASDFCKASKLGLSDGTQKRGGSCSSTPQGSLPSAQNMVSTLIVNPDNGAQVDASKDLLVRLNTRNLVTGFFDDPNAKYYLSPQTLDGSGRVQGHQHAVIQKIVSLHFLCMPNSDNIIKGRHEST